MIWRHITEEEAVNFNQDTANTHQDTASLGDGSAGHLDFLGSNIGYTRESSVRHQYRSTYFSSLNSQISEAAQIEVKISTLFPVTWDGCQGGGEGRSREMWINKIQEKNLLLGSLLPPHI